MVSTHMCLVWVFIQHNGQPREYHNIFVEDHFNAIVRNILIYRNLGLALMDPKS
jgi:hypothetical protein